MAVHFSNPYGRIDVETDASVARFTRSSLPLPTIIEMEIFHDNVGRALDRLNRSRYSLLVDLREAQGTSSSGLEASLASGRRRMLSGFVRVAIVVKTAAGALQVLRHAREDGIDVRVFQDDEAGALAFVRMSMSPGSSSSPASPSSSPSGPSSGIPSSAPSSAHSPSSHSSSSSLLSSTPTSDRQPPRSGVMEVDAGPPSMRPPASWPTAKIGR